MKIGDKVEGIFKVEYKGVFTIIFRDEYNIGYSYITPKPEIFERYYNSNITGKQFSITGYIEDYGIEDKYKITDVRINEKETKILEALDRI